MRKTPLMSMAVGMALMLSVVGCQTQKTSSDALRETRIQPASDQSFSQTANKDQREEALPDDYGSTQEIGEGDWKITVHGYRPDPDSPRDGWGRTTFDLVIENQSEELLQLTAHPKFWHKPGQYQRCSFQQYSSDGLWNCSKLVNKLAYESDSPPDLSRQPFQFTAHWRDATYEGFVLFPVLYLPPGYGATGVAIVDIPEAAYDVRYVLGGETIEPKFGYPPLSPIPTDRQDQPSELVPIEEEGFTLSLEVVDNCCQDGHNLNILVRNKSAQDIFLTELPFQFQAWNLKGQPVGAEKDASIQSMETIGRYSKAVAPLQEISVKTRLSSGQLGFSENSGAWHLLVIGDQLAGGYQVYRFTVNCGRARC